MTASAIDYVAFIAIRVTDIKASLNFYQKALGFNVLSRLLSEGKSPTAKEFGVESVQTEMWFLERDGTRIELLQQNLPGELKAAPEASQLGFSHFGLRVSDLDNAAAAVKEFGGKLVPEASHSDARHQSRLARVLDPDGLKIMLIEMPGDPTKPLGEDMRQQQD